MTGPGQGADEDGGAEISGSPLSSALAALSQAPIGIAIFDRQMRYLAASRHFLTDQGLPGDTPLIGRLHYDVFPEIPQRWRDLHARVLRDGEPISHEADPFVDRNGRLEWIRWSLAPWREDGGEIGGLVLYTEVVTPSVEARMRLEAAEARYHTVFDQAAIGIARVAPDGIFLEVNDRFCEITGYPRPEISQLSFQKITHPDDLEADLAKVRAVFAGEMNAYSIEKRYLYKSGGVVWVNLTVALVRKAGGEPDYFVSMIEDITARKTAEAAQQRYQEQLRLLINELNHRVKNTLATVQSIAAQTLRAERDPAVAYEKFEARLLSLSDAHEVLTRERWHGAVLQEVAERSLRPFSAGVTQQVRLSGPEVWLPPGAALTLALVLHELATNAVKYGALSSQAGAVELSWRFDPVDRRLEMSWRESDGPPVNPPARKGFGSRLIERSFRGEFGGGVTMTYDPTGLTCAMQARLPPPADPLGALDDA